MNKTKSVNFICFVFLLIISLSEICEAGQEKVEIQKSKINKLTEVAINAYDVELRLIEQYAITLQPINSEADEDLYQELFADPITLFQKIINLEKDNFKAHLYLGKSYHRKAYQGFGYWNKELVIKAKEEYLIATSLSKRINIKKELIKDLTAELEDVEKILRSSSEE